MGKNKTAKPRHAAFPSMDGTERGADTAIKPL